MPAEKLTVSWDEISSPRVDDRLKLLDSAAAAVNSRAFDPTAVVTPKRTSVFYNSLVYMTLFGLLGGLLGWGISAAMNFPSSARQEAHDAIDSRHEIEAVIASGDFSAEQGNNALQILDEDNKDNPYYTLARNAKLSPEQRASQESEIESRDQWKNFLADLLFYGVSGMTIAVCLAIAEPMIERNWRGVVVNGSVAAVLGVAGGVVVSLFINQFRVMVVSVIADAQTPLIKSILSNAVQWGTLGLFIGSASGIVLKSARKTAAGATGGFIGGLIGGAIYDPVVKWTGGHEQVFARLVAICVIGTIAGLGTGLIENAVKTGWLKVSTGLIAGKQFILYRDPTYIGSALSCHIYLFRDPAVGKRHAAVHIVPGGFEIENLPLGSGTLVNQEQVVGRRRLRSGDNITIGSTTMMFQEKTKAA